MYIHIYMYVTIVYAVNTRCLNLLSPWCLRRSSAPSFALRGASSPDPDDSVRDFLGFSSLGLSINGTIPRKNHFNVILGISMFRIYGIIR